MTLEVISLTKMFAAFHAVHETSFNLGPGQVLSLLGPSGCGKTTTLRMIAGFENPTAGTIKLSNRDITQLPARKRNIGMVFQSYALFPHLSAAENVAFGLDTRHVSRSDRGKRVKRALEIVRMVGFDDRMPKNMSGGQQQRIALARALVIEPDLLLLDEPLSALDLKLREEMRDEIYRIVRELNITTVFVTHDQSEALVLSDLVAVMNAGRIEQMDTPQRIYRSPTTSFVADFIGGANVLKGRLGASNAATFETEAGFVIALPQFEKQEAVAIAVRPEDIKMVPAQNAADATATVVRSRFLGNHIEYTVETHNGAALTVRSDSRVAYPEGQRILLSFDSERLVLLAQ